MMHRYARVAEATFAQYSSPTFAVHTLPPEQLAALEAGECDVDWRAELLTLSAVATVLRRYVSEMRELRRELSQRAI